MYVYKGDFFSLAYRLCLACPTMTVYQWQVQKLPRLDVSAGLRSTPEVGSNAGGGTDLPGRVRASRQREHAFFFCVSS